MPETELFAKIAAVFAIPCFVIAALRLISLGGRSPLSFMLPLLVILIGSGMQIGLVAKEIYDLTPAAWALPISVLLHFISTWDDYKNGEAPARVGWKPRAAIGAPLVMFGLLFASAGVEYIQASVSRPLPLKILSFHISDVKVGGRARLTASLIRDRNCPASINRFYFDTAGVNVLRQQKLPAGQTSASPRIKQVFEGDISTETLRVGTYRVKTQRIEHCPEGDRAWTIPFEPTFRVLP